jgi:methenyltetrahydromethanopterin cyclohydrolase
MTQHEALSRINPEALRIADRMEAGSAALGVQPQRLANGCRLLDAGVEAKGSLAAARHYAEACLGGLGRVRVAPRTLGPAVLFEARVEIDAPLVACLASQYAGWKVQTGAFFAMGSGPARAVRGAEPLFDRFPLRIAAESTVLLLETERLPDAAVAEAVAAGCGIPASALTLIAARTGSLVGSTQVAARSVETALHKLLELGFDLTTIVAGAGTCPIAPGHPDTLRAIGRTNDAVLYGAEVALWVQAEDERIEAILDRVPSAASREHGRLFHDLLREHGDFYGIDPLLFSPARVTFVNAATGKVHAAGSLDEGTLMKSFGITDPRRGGGASAAG